MTRVDGVFWPMLMACAGGVIAGVLLQTGHESGMWIVVIILLIGVALDTPEGGAVV